MKRMVLFLVVAVMLIGCCARCGRAQETVTMTSKQVLDWKQGVFDGLNKISNNPYDAICNLFLQEAFGMSQIPVAATATVTIKKADHTRMMKVSKRINATLGFNAVARVEGLESNKTALDDAIASATDVISDQTERARFIKKATALKNLFIRATAVEVAPAAVEAPPVIEEAVQKAP